MNQIKIIKSKFLKNLFDQNTYVICSNKNAVIIDAGAEIEDVLDAVKGKFVQAILITHLHFDHIWNLEKYIDTFYCNVYICNGEQNRFLDSKLNGSYVIKKDMQFFIMPQFIQVVRKNMKFDDIEIEAFYLPGHTNDCVGYLWRGNLFSGDVLFQNGIGRTDLPDSSDKKMIQSLASLLSIDFETLYPGHYSYLSKSQVKKMLKND